MAAFHLRLQEASELAVARPAYAVPLLDAGLNYYVRMHDDVDVDPDAIRQDLVKLRVCVRIFLVLSSAEFSPEALAAAITVLR